MHKLKIMLTTLLAITLLVPNVCFADEFVEVTEHVDGDVEQSSAVQVAEEVDGNQYMISIPDRTENDDIGPDVPTLQSSVLPATYLPGDPTAVKDQGEEGLCWAYATTKSMELSTYHSEESTRTLSPLQFAKTFYKTGAVDQFGLTSGDRVINRSSGNGGNDITSIFAAMTQATPTVNQSGTYADVKQHPKAALFYDTSSILEIKQAIYEYGACTIAVQSRNNENGCWYETSPDYLLYNHEITLVGWQDTVSKSNFTNAGGEHPANNGAFRFVNSWGLDGFGDQAGKGGYGWLSYEDVTFTDSENNRGLVYDMTTDWDADNVYQNDGCYAYATRTTARCAELFQTKGATAYEELKSAIVGLHSSGSYTAWVYRVQDTDEDLTDQVLLGTQDFEMPAGHYGYVTVDFETPIVFGAGDTFAIAVTRKDGSQFTMLVDAQADYSYAQFKPTSPQNSYYFNETKYSTADNSAPRIKAVTKDLTATDKTGTMDDYIISLDYSRLMYNGEPQYPDVTIQDIDGNLQDNANFKFSYNNNINASDQAEIVITSTNPKILGSQSKKFTIAKRPLDDVITERNYVGIANTSYKTFLQTVYMSYKNKVILYGNDYTVTEPLTLLGYGDNSITLYGTGNFNSSVTIIVQGTQNGVPYDSLTISKLPNKIYTGKEIKLEPNEYNIKYGTQVLNYGTDFRLTYKNNVEAGKATVTFVGLGAFTGASGDIATFEIKPLNVNDCVIQTPDSVAYMNQPVTLIPGETIFVYNRDASVLIDSSNYVMDYSNNQGLGTMTAYIRGNKNLTGAVPCNVEIVQARMENAVITVEDANYTGSPVTPKVSVSLDGIELRENYDYTLRYSDNIGPGKGTVTVLGQYYIQGYREVTFNIIAPTLDKAVITNLDTTYYYTGTAIEPDIKVSIGDTELTKGVDYTIRYENNIEIGKAYIHVIGADKYQGSSKTATFLIVEDPTVIYDIYKGELTSASANVLVKSKLSYEAPFAVTKVRVSNKKLASATKNGRIKTKGKTGKVVIELYGSTDNEVYAYTLNIIKPTFKAKKYNVKVGDTIELDNIINFYKMTPNEYKISKSNKVAFDEKNRTIKFLEKGTVKLKFVYENSKYHPTVKFKIKSTTISENKS